MSLFNTYCISAALIFTCAACIATNNTIGKQQAQIDQLTERVLLLETALSDKSGIKPEKTK